MANAKTKPGFGARIREDPDRMSLIDMTVLHRRWQAWALRQSLGI